MKKTAVEWLFEKMTEKGTNPYWDLRFEQAKEMEKEQRINDMHFGHGISSNVNINYEAYFKLERNKK